MKQTGQIEPSPKFFWDVIIHVHTREGSWTFSLHKLHHPSLITYSYFELCFPKHNPKVSWWMYPPKIKCLIQITEFQALSPGSRYIMVNNDLWPLPWSDPRSPSKLISYFSPRPSLHTSSTGFLERIKHHGPTGTFPLLAPLWDHSWGHVHGWLPHLLRTLHQRGRSSPVSPIGS